MKVKTSNVWCGASLPGAWSALTVIDSWVGLVCALAAVSLAGAGCSLWDETPGAGSPANAARRDRPDDSEPGTLIPAGAKTVIDVDMAALRGSPWVAPALESRDARVRAAKEQALGYDDVRDVDRLIYAVTAAGGDAPTLVIAQGRFQVGRIEEAFRARWPAAVVDGWRGVSVLASGENGMAMLTPRTFISGNPAAVHAVIDRAFGLGADLAADPALGPTRRALCPEGSSAKPVVLAVVAIDDRIRARVGNEIAVPPELREIGLRVDLGQMFDARALGVLDDREAAAALARRLAALLSDRATRLMARALGLGMLLDGARVTAEGARVVAVLSIGDEHRAQVAAMLRALVMRSSGDLSGTGAFGSW